MSRTSIQPTSRPASSCRATARSSSGYSGATATTDVALVRYNADGTLDTSFDGDGKRTYAIGGGADQAFGLLLESTGKYVVAAAALSPVTGADLTLARFNPDGSFDASFDTDGIAASYDSGR